MPHRNPSGSRIRILFVDDDKLVLDGLRRGVHATRLEWHTRFALTGAEALAQLEVESADVVVTDMRMAGMNGRELLVRVKELYPRTVRLVLSGYADATSIIQVAGVAHQYLAKPCDVVILKAAITRSFALRRLLHDRRLVEQVGDIDQLPSLPGIYQRMVRCLQAPEPNLAEVAKIISSDIAMTATVLKLANSAFFGARQQLRTAERAVSFLGLNTIAGLVLAHSIFLDVAFARAPGLNLDVLWRHSLEAAVGMKALATHEKWSVERVEEAYLAGVLHDVGKIVLAIGKGRPGGGAGQPAESASDILNQGEAGAYLLGLWGFSDSIIEAIAFQHHPADASSREVGLPVLLHVANQFAHEFGTSDPTENEPGLDGVYLESLGLTDRLADWRAAWHQSGQVTCEKTP